MKQALILCGGKATRLRPYSYGLPKANMPFLNLPLLSLGWFYLEQLNISHFLLNAHLFPKKLKATVEMLSQPHQTSTIFPEPKCFGGAGTLYKLKTFLQKQGTFFYLNGDSLFFPSHIKQLVSLEEDFLKTNTDGSFFVSPFPEKNFNKGGLWCDKEMNLKFIGKRNQLPKKFKNLLPFHFSGLALFKSSLLNQLNPGAFHLFEDFIIPLIKKKKFKVFSDQRAHILEGGEITAYLESIKFCLNALFKNSNGEVKNLLLKYFSRFDPEDQQVGFKNGATWGKKLGFPLLAPDSVKGLTELNSKRPRCFRSKNSIFLEKVI